MVIKRSLLFLIWMIGTVFVSNANPPFFTTGIALTEKGELVFAQKGLKRVDLFSADGAAWIRSYPVDETPTGVVVDGQKAYVTTFEKTGKLLVLDLGSGKIEATIPTGSGACYPLLGPDKKQVYVCNRFSATVSEIDVRKKCVVRTVRVLREPSSAVFSQDGKYLFVANFLPAQRADVDVVAACVSVVDMRAFEKVKDIRLANGSNALRDICITPDGKYIYVSHNLGRFTAPTSQLQQGWMNTSAFSVIDVADQTFLGAVVVDEPERGAAGVWSIDCNEEHLFIAHSGTHEVSVIDHPGLRRKFEAHPHQKKLDYDLQFLYGLRERIPLQGNGPRYLLINGGVLWVPTYFADVLNKVDIDTRTVQAMELNPGRHEIDAHKGERIFNDAKMCFQEWQSCNGCHPGDGRMDAMNWDLMNDGIGNPKNCKSLLYSHATPPCMISGIREKAEIAVHAGFVHIQFYNISKEEASYVDEYLKALRPAPSPFLVNGHLSGKAKEGKKVFEKHNCGSCHSGPYYTDMKMYRIGEDVEFAKGWDTPTLIEVWRTAPYLFDGRAATMEEVFEIHKHGIKKEITKKEIEALSEYVKSL
jgi:YVTN family beta-propeller protein